MLTPEQLATLSQEVGKQAADRLDGQFKTLEKNLQDKAAELNKGMMTSADFEAYKAETTKQAQDLLSAIDVIKQANQEQAGLLQTVIDKAKPGQKKTIEDVIREKAPEIKRIYSEGRGFIEITGAQLKAAGVQSIAGTVDPASPYVPGISGTPLEIFDVARNPNFMLSRVDMGTTDASRMAWINEIDAMEGAVNTNVGEGNTKPQIQHKFNVQYTDYKKAAAWMELTEEFDQDIPALSADLRRLLQEDVYRAFDDQIQADVLAAAVAFNISGLNSSIQDANLWDALFSLYLQPGVYNFIPNTVALNWITDGKVQMGKNVNGSYLIPPFREELERLRVRANKIVTNTAIAGDLRQYRVRMYQDYVMRIGWINNQFIQNKFSVLGELKYHSFISDNRRRAIAKGDLNSIVLQIDGTPGS